MKFLTWQNPEQLIVAQEFIKIFKILSCGIKVIYFKDEKGLPEYGGGKWIPKSIRHFVKDELDFIVKADVVASQYGLSVSFLRRDGITSYIPLFEYSNLVVGDRIYMKKAKLLTLRRSGYNDIFRIVL